MPTNLAENALSALKVGNENVTAAYVGNSQIFPNTTELTSWDGWYPNQTLPATQTSWTVGVYGDIGATYQITGTNQNVASTGPVAGTISQPGRNLLTIPIASNNTCGNAQRQLGANIAVTGDTTLATGFGSTQSFITQSAGPITYTFTGTNSSITVQNTVNVPFLNNTRFGVGSKWIVTYTYGGGTYSPSAPSYKAVPNIELYFSSVGNTGHVSSFNSITQPAGMTQLSTDSTGTSGYQRWTTTTGGYTTEAVTGTYSFEQEITAGSISSITWYGGEYLTLFPYGTQSDPCGTITGVDYNTFAITVANPTYP